MIELLVVISIMGLIAALAVPALKNMGKSNIQASATRQLLDDIGRARQLAISQHTTVYMVFVPTNFWQLPDASGNTILSDLTSATIPVPSDLQAAFQTLTNLIDKQLTGYNFISLGRVGDQPGQHSWRYLDEWKALPDGDFITAAKFQMAAPFNPLRNSAWESDYSLPGQIDNWRSSGGSFIPQIYPFVTNSFPFPTEKCPSVSLPNIAFDFTGRLISEFDGFNYHHAYIPLSQGSVFYGRDANKQPQPTTVQVGDITETPPGNSTNLSYNIIDIDPLSGRARLLTHQIP